MVYETSASELDIIRDISRTFPSHVFFQKRHGPGQRSLYNVLKAYSVYDRDVGYVQVYPWFLFFPFTLLFPQDGSDLKLMVLKKIAGNGFRSRFVASLYERRRCVLVISCITQRSCSLANGRIVSGETFFTLKDTDIVATCLFSYASLTTIEPLLVD